MKRNDDLAEYFARADFLEAAWQKARTWLLTTGHGTSESLNYPRHDVVMLQMRAVDLELMCARAWRPEF